MTLVIDASILVAALVDETPVGRWAESLFAERLFAPHHLPAEATNSLNRAARVGDIPPEVASLAYVDMLAVGMRTTLVPYAPYAERIWELRANVTSYDAWYVALAESLDAPLATLDYRLARAPGPRCAFVTPP